MDENAPLAQSSLASTRSSSESEKLRSLSNTLSFLSSKYGREIAASLNYNEKNDRRYQREMRKLAKEREMLKNNPEALGFN